MSSKQNDQYNEMVAESVKLCRYCKDELIGNGTMHYDCYQKWSHETFNGLENVSDSVEDHHPTPEIVPVVAV